jgi:hypothetical protein
MAGEAETIEKLRKELEDEKAAHRATREQLDHAQVRACPCCVCPQFASCCFSLKASARPSAAGCLETKERG